MPAVGLMPVRLPQLIASDGASHVVAAADLAVLYVLRRLHLRKISATRHGWKRDLKNPRLITVQTEAFYPERRYWRWRCRSLSYLEYVRHA
jgi:hypothetical protein